MAPGRLALARRRGHGEGPQEGPVPPTASENSGDAHTASGLGEVPGHSPGDRPSACARVTQGGVRPARGASEEAQGEREARGRPSTQEPAGGSQQCCHGSAVPTAGSTFSEKDRGIT